MGQQKMDEKRKRGEKVTARDIEFQKKFALKTKQMMLKALARYANSLTGSSGLHPPIIMKEDNVKKDTGKAAKGEEKDDAEKKKKEEEKRLKEERLAKQKTKKGDDKEEKIREQKMRDDEAVIKKDQEQEKNWEDPIKGLETVQDVAVLETKLLDLLLGLHRVTDSMERFPNLVNNFQTTDMQAKIIIKVIKSVLKALKKIQLDKLPAEKQPAVRRFVVYFMCMINEAFKSYGRDDLDGKGIKLLQEALISIGMRETAEAMFTKWSENMKNKAAAAAE